MVVGADGVAVGAERRTTAGAGRPSRREVARGLLACAAVLAPAPVVTASRPALPARHPDRGCFEETYRGRRIQGVAVPDAGHETTDCDWRITVDGSPLHLMRRADGTWLSMVDHYTSYRTPLEATRAAVDELAPGLRLRGPVPGSPDGQPAGGHAHGGGHHGVRA
ncbi:tyrosinase family oxidase copper chaperone [Streptomyces cyanogenus]|uniref:Tyrosinase co-factor MelC1 n=1 Tax=Streptomyces cyanogenus TaxID=80860 RepID=A0ABX7TS29_STRCY|nr:tyrosinase family oxidase copper chaperone [Streptomyces cyanogenus]QTD98633.1 Tyrosinase co-factor MelC1 [Streptomyces cyanogenus]